MTGPWVVGAHPRWHSQVDKITWNHINLYSNKDIWPRKGNSGKGVQNAILKSFKEASLVAQVVKNLPAMLETQVQSLGQEDPLEKGMATHSNILA